MEFGALHTIPGAVVGGQIGSRFQGAVSSTATERLIVVLFAVVGLAFAMTVALVFLAN